MTTYLFDYEYQGETFELAIPADSREEAQGRKAAAGYAEYVGEMVASIPVTPSGVAQRLVGWQFFVGLGLGALLEMLLSVVLR